MHRTGRIFSTITAKANSRALSSKNTAGCVKGKRTFLLLAYTENLDSTQTMIDNLVYLGCVKRSKI